MRGERSESAARSAVAPTPRGPRVELDTDAGVSELDAPSARAGRAEPSDADGGSMVEPVAPAPPSMAAPQPAAADPGVVVSDPQDDAASLFDQTRVRSYNLILSAADLATLNLNPAAEQYVTGAVEVDGERVEGVGIRYKGSVGAFVPPCTALSGSGPKAGKCSIKLAFDHVDDDARFRGLKKLNLHSANLDPSYLRDRLAYALFRDNGVAAPRAMHARVSINGVLEGLYIAVEQVDGRFTRSRFSEGGKGNLYKEVWPQYDDAQIYLDALETNRDEQPSADKLQRFKAAIGGGPEAAARWLDRDYVLRYLAVDRLTINDDGFLHWWCGAKGQGNNPGGIGNHNYYWYEASTTERLWLIPWDMDNTFNGAAGFVHIEPEWRRAGACDCGDPLASSIAATCDSLIRQWAEWRDDYEAAVDSLLQGAFSEAAIEAKLAAWTSQIDPLVRETDGLNLAPGYASWAIAVEDLRGIIDSSRRNRGYPY